MNPSRLLALAVVPIVLLAVPACVTPSQNRREALVRIAHQYNDGLRWGRYQDVVAHLAPEEAERFLSRTGVLAEDFEMADNEVSGINFLDGGTRAQVTVDFTWYNQRRSLLRKTVVGQDWRFRDGRWICAAQRRVRGDRFPLIPDAIAEVNPPGTPTSASPSSPRSAPPSLAAPPLSEARVVAAP